MNRHYLQISTVIYKYFKYSLLGILGFLRHVKMRQFDHILTFDRHVSGIAVTMILGKPRIYVNGACEIAHTGTPWSLDLNWEIFTISKMCST